MANVMELLPIGSVVLLRGAKKKLMIYGVRQTSAETKKEYDYIAVMYPEGNVGGKSQVMFNHEDIEEIFYQGFENEERMEFLSKLNAYYTPLEN